MYKHENGLELISDKLVFYEYLKDYSILSPFISKDLNIFLKKLGTPEKFILASKWGKTVVFNKNGLFNIDKNSYLMEYIPKQKEYVINIYSNNIIGIFEIKLRDKYKNNNTQFLIKDTKNSYLEEKDTHQVKDSILENAMASINCLGLEFGSVHLIYNNFRDKSYILNVKSSKELEVVNKDFHKDLIKNPKNHLKNEEKTLSNTKVVLNIDNLYLDVNQL